MKNRIGPPVTGDDFFNREEELERLRRAVEDGNHVLISAPRRVGKSSLVLKLCDHLGQHGWTVVQLDVQDVSDEVGLVRALLQALKDAGLKLPRGLRAEEIFRRLRNLFKGNKAKAAGVEVEIGGDETGVWDEIGGSLKRVLKEAGESGRVLIAVDELPVFLSKLSDLENGPSRAREVLDWLRAVRHAAGARVTWVVSGSIGLESFVERRGLQGTINDFLPQALGAYSDEVAVAFLKCLGESPEYGVNMPDSVCGEILARVGWPLPYYLQLLFHSLLQRPSARRTAPDFPTEADVADAYEELLEPSHASHFSVWDSRLDQQFDDPADAGVARYLLTRTCRQERGHTQQKLFDLLVARQPNADPDALDRRLRSILELLERDGYLLRAGDTYAFRSFLLRDYWQRRYA